MGEELRQQHQLATQATTVYEYDLEFQMLTSAASAKYFSEVAVQQFPDKKFDPTNNNHVAWLAFVGGMLREFPSVQIYSWGSKNPRHQRADLPYDESAALEWFFRMEKVIANIQMNLDSVGIRKFDHIVPPEEDFRSWYEVFLESVSSGKYYGMTDFYSNAMLERWDGRSSSLRTARFMVGLCPNMQLEEEESSPFNHHAELHIPKID